MFRRFGIRPRRSPWLWHIPVQNGAPQLLYTFQGFTPSAAFSPDRAHLAFWRRPEPGSGRRPLHLLELTSLEQVHYTAGELLAFQGWSMNSNSFLYTQGAPAQAWLGGLCRLPGLVSAMDSAPLSLQWVDAERFLSLVATQGPWELRLFTPAGTQTLAQLWGEGVEYDFAWMERVP